MRRNARGRRRGCSRRAGMIDAARRWKARATAGCAQAPDQKPQASPTLTTSQAWQSSFTGRGEKVRFRETETKPVRQDGRESTNRLRDDLELVAVISQQATMHMSQESLNVVEDRTACEAGGELSCDKRREIFEVLYMLSRASKP